MKQNRREFIGTAALLGTSSSFANHLRAENGASSFNPIVVSSANGLKATAKAMEHILAGADALDAVIAGVNLVEDDPNDMTVGYGGLPNEEGVVELDSCVMHGPTGRGGGVASLRSIKNPSRVAKVVMERTDHVLMVGEGALRFARAHGFKEENLLTQRAREAWLSWKESLSNRDDWLPPHDPAGRNIGGLPKKHQREYGTINCNAMDLNGGLSGCTTTSGLAYKIPGRVGDSPILGAGLYVDNEVGAAGSTGRGEANLLSCSSVMVVEFMRDGLSPEAACLKACERIATQTKMQRLLDDRDRPNFNVTFYAVNRRGEFGSGSIWSGSEMAVNTGEKISRLLSSAYLYKRD
ncbi:N(4)-(beta-N-acetylglucosaminyl)-L-asparaginase [bacterium]|nr:N(4)-(beta-N-acetylglucosaminyl)-L-asparaginase [bacterium]